MGASLSINNESKVIWLTCPDCGSKIGIIISVGKTATPIMSIEEKVEDWPPSNLVDKLGNLGIDMNLLNIEETNDQTIITPKKFLGDQWGSINNAIRELGGNWIREGRESRWEIKKDNSE